MPMIKPTHFYQHLADLGKLHLTYGGQDPHMLAEFWRRFALSEPNNTINSSFDSGALCPARTIPLVLHGDEGRGKKRQPVMVVNTHPLMGFGTRACDEYLRDAPEFREQSMGVNLKGASVETRFLAFVMPKVLYGKGACFLHTMFDELVADLVKLQTEGVLIGDERWHLATIGAVGDLQFFQKMCNLTRSYTHISKRSGQEMKNGICHLCLGGRPNISFEDFSDNPAWYASMGVEEPWETVPALIRKLHVDVGNPAWFLRPDIWHCMHLGAGKYFLASAFVEWLPHLPGKCGIQSGTGFAFQALHLLFQGVRFLLLVSGLCFQGVWFLLGFWLLLYRMCFIMV